MDKEQVKRVIGTLASNIRGDWNSIDDRLYEIIDLCESIDRHDLADEIRYDREEICSDGRWFEHWSGPYAWEYEDFATKEDFRCVGVSPNILLHKNQYLKF